MKRENRQNCPVSAFRSSGRVEGAVQVLQAVQVPFCSVASILRSSSAVKLAIYGFLLRFKHSKMPRNSELRTLNSIPNKPNRSVYPI